MIDLISTTMCTMIYYNQFFSWTNSQLFDQCDTFDSGSISLTRTKCTQCLASGNCQPMKRKLPFLSICASTPECFKLILKSVLNFSFWQSKSALLTPPPHSNNFDSIRMRRIWNKVQIRQEVAHHHLTFYFNINFASNLKKITILIYNILMKLNGQT